MSSKRKQAKDKQAASHDAPPVSVSARPVRGWLLAEKPTVRAHTTSPAFSIAKHMTSGRPSGALQTDLWLEKRNAWLAAPPSPNATSQGLNPAARRAVFEGWTSEVARRLCSPSLHPHHTVKVAVELPHTEPGLTSVDNSAGAQVGSSNGASPPCPAARAIASVIRRLLIAHTALLNACYDPANAEAPYDPVKDVERLVGYSVCSSGGYCGPEMERKDAAFDPAHATVKSGPRRLRFATHSDATHVNVCCGAYYYQLAVVDGKSGGVVSEEQLAVGLETIRAHAEATAAAFDAVAISAEDRHELQSVRGLLAAMSCVHDDVAADLQRRLRDVSEVNRYSLEQLEGGLFTVVLLPSGGTALDAAETSASQWLNSCLSLYAAGPPGAADTTDSATMAELTIRVSAFVGSLDTVHHFLTYALGKNSCSVLSDAMKGTVPDDEAELRSAREALSSATRASLSTATANPTGATATAATTRPSSSGRRSVHLPASRGSSTSPALPAAQQQQQQQQQQQDVSTASAVPVDELAAKNSRAGRGSHANLDRCTALTTDGSVAFLELWLPQRHRVPLIPPAPVLYTPRWQTVSLGSSMKLADLCLSIVLGTEATVKADTTFRWASGDSSDGRTGDAATALAPRVVLSLLLPDNPAPRKQRLYSDDVNRYIQLHRSNSVLITAEVRSAAKETARESVAACIRSCFSREVTDEGELHDDQGSMNDVNINVAVTTRTTTAAMNGGNCPGVMVNSFTETGVPAVVQIRCNAVQVAAERSLSLPECFVPGAIEVGPSTPSAASSAALLIANTVAELPHQ